MRTLASIFLTVLTGILLLKPPPIVVAAKITILANNTSAINYADAWKPSFFDCGSTLDDLFLGKHSGPNSSDCVSDVPSMQAIGYASFTFEFYGVSAELILTSGPDHAPFDVSLDGQAIGSGDTYSEAPMCGVAWASPTTLSLSKHTLRCVSRVLPSKSYLRLELLAIVYDDGIPATTTERETVAFRAAPSGSFSRSNSHKRILWRSTSNTRSSSTSTDHENATTSSSASAPTASAPGGTTVTSSAALGTVAVIAIGFGAGYFVLIVIVGVLVLIVLTRRCRTRPTAHRSVFPRPSTKLSKLRQAKRVRLIVKSVDLTAPSV